MSLTLTDGHRLRVYKKKFLRNRSRPGREEFTGCWNSCTVVNDIIFNRIKGYEMCVGRVARVVKNRKA